MKYQEKDIHIEIDGRKFHCALDVTMADIGGKWKTVILWYLRNKTMRFSKLKREVPNITEKMLSLQLRELERSGFVGRKVYPQVPPRVECFLTKPGEQLIPILNELAKWSRLKRETDHGTFQSQGLKSASPQQWLRYVTSAQKPTLFESRFPCSASHALRDLRFDKALRLLNLHPDFVGITAASQREISPRMSFSTIDLLFHDFTLRSAC